MDTDSRRISLNINKKPATKTPSVPQEVRTKGEAILKNKLSKHLDSGQLKDLEQSINKETFKALEREGLIDINPNDQRVQRTYDQYLRKSCLHIDPESPVQNKTLLIRLQQVDEDGDGITVADVVTISPVLLHPVSWARQYEAQALEARQVADGGAKAAKTKIYKCNKCMNAGRNYRNVAIKREEQRRGGDEPMSVDLVCNECGFQWTQK